MQRVNEIHDEQFEASHVGAWPSFMATKCCSNRTEDLDSCDCDSSNDIGTMKLDQPSPE